MAHTQWKFKDLVDIAEHCEGRAVQYRDSAERFTAKSHRHIDYTARAAELESIAYMLRNTEIKLISDMRDTIADLLIVNQNQSE